VGGYNYSSGGLQDDLYEGGGLQDELAPYLRPPAPPPAPAPAPAPYTPPPAPTPAPTQPAPAPVPGEGTLNWDWGYTPPPAPGTGTPPFLPWGPYDTSWPADYSSQTPPWWGGRAMPWLYGLPAPNWQDYYGGAPGGAAEAQARYNVMLPWYQQGAQHQQALWQMEQNRWAQAGQWGHEYEQQRAQLEWERQQQQRALEYERWQQSGQWGHEEEQLGTRLESEERQLASRLQSEELQQTISTFGHRWRPHTRWM